MNATSTYGTRHIPEEIKVHKADKTLEIVFDDGKAFTLTAELLRVESPSAEVQGHSPDEKKVLAGRRHVGIIAVEPVGNYAVKLVFDDLHDTGIYSWDYLRSMGENQDRMWQNYLAALEAAGLSRDPHATGVGTTAPAPKSGGGCGGGGGHGGGHGHGGGGCGCGGR